MVEISVPDYSKSDQLTLQSKKWSLCFDLDASKLARNLVAPFTDSPKTLNGTTPQGGRDVENRLLIFTVCAGHDARTMRKFQERRSKTRFLSGSGSFVEGVVGTQKEVQIDKQRLGFGIPGENERLRQIDRVEFSQFSPVRYIVCHVIARADQIQPTGSMVTLVVTEFAIKHCA